MKEIARRIWYEPAVAIGLLLSLAMLVITLTNGDDWDWDTVVFVLGPLLTGLGTRSLVKPTAKIEDENKQAAVSSLKTP